MVVVKYLILHIGMIANFKRDLLKWGVDEVPMK